MYLAGYAFLQSEVVRGQMYLAVYLFLQSEVVGGQERTEKNLNFTAYSTALYICISSHAGRSFRGRAGYPQTSKHISH